MDEHASIFYIKPMGRYALCYDSDLEQLKAPSREAMPRKRPVDKAGGYAEYPLASLFCVNGLSRNMLSMRIAYKPEHTEYMKSASGFVERIVALDQAWLDNMFLQFDMAYPAGLPSKLIKTYKKPEV